MEQALTSKTRIRLAAALAAWALSACGTMAQTTYRFDFGAAGTEPGYVAVSNTTTYSAAQGYGWVSTTGLNLRDRASPGLLRRDFIFANTVSGVVFRISGLTPSGKYLLKVLCGDANYGDHVITVSVPGAGTLPTMSPRTGQFLQLSASVNADSSGLLNITFGSPTPNWVVNALTVEPTATDLTPVVESSPFNEWDSTVFASDPTPALLATWSGAAPPGFTATGRTRADYLTLITSEVDFWKTKQNSSGAIIDPYRNVETQYATPAFANAAALLVVRAGRSDLVEPAALAMDWATLRLHNRVAADSHEDFYPAMLVHALRLLKPHVTTTRAATWEANLNYDPYGIYRQAIGSMNWNIVSSSGEALLQLQGLRATSNGYVTESWAAQGRNFHSPYGLYEEGPMAYDHFPRLWLADALEQGYAGSSSAEVRTALDRAAITSLFMQSPWGELPAGGRSAHHQWNEAEQCVTYEIHAAKAKGAGNAVLAGAYKRAAHLALSSMFRWVRPAGEMQVVKNWVDPSSRHGYESYSYHSQYNLLPMAMLSMAYDYAASSEDVAEGPAPADTGGFVFKLDNLHKVFANAGGTYVEIDTSGDHHYDATGLIRVHKKGVPAQLGPSDSLLSSSSYASPNPSTVTTGVGVSWQDGAGAWKTLGSMDSTQITSVTVTPVEQSAARVVFDVTYAGALPNATSIIEHYVVTPEGVQLTTQVTGYSGPLRYVWPVLAADGKTTSTIGVSGTTVTVSQGGTPQTFTTPGASSVSVAATNYSNHNGWARLATAEFPSGGTITLLISQSSPSTAYWKGDVDAIWSSGAAGDTNWAITESGAADTGAVPGAETDVVFAATGAVNMANTLLGANFQVGGLFVSTPSSVGIGGTHILTLGAGGITLAAGAGAATLNTSGPVVLGASQTWTNDSVNPLIVSSVVAGSGFGITKAGAGALTLSGANTYTGATSVNAGTLLVDGSLAAGSAVTVADGATLGGSGVVGGPTTINGTHSPGNSAGTQTFGSTLGYGATSHLKWELAANSVSAGTSDKVSVSGAVTAASGAKVDVVLEASGSSVALNNPFWTQSRTWTVLSGSSLTGTFTLGAVSADPGGRAVGAYGALALQQTATALMVVFTPYTPTELWRRSHFAADWNNPSVAGDAVDADKDGLPNRLEYALGSDPKTPSAASAPRGTTTGGKLQIIFTRNTAAADLTISVVAADFLTGEWTEIARSVDGAAFASLAPGAVVSESGSGTNRNVEVTDIVLVADPAHARRFMKVEVR